MSLEQMIKEKNEEILNTFDEFKKTNDERLKDIEKKGNADVLVKEHTEKSNAAIEKLQGEIEEMKTALSRTQTGEVDAKDIEDASAEYKQGFFKHVKTGQHVQLDEKQAGYKAMSIDSDPDGGYLVPAQMSNEIVKRVFETSPIRGLASQQTISSDRLEMLEDVDEADAGWVGERQARPETNTPQIFKIVIPADEIYAQPKATQRLLDDAAVNLEAWLSEKISEKMRRVENSAFVSGDGVEKPMGFLSYDATAGEAYEFGKIRQVTSTGTSGSLDEADDFLNLLYELKEDYLMNASFVMKRQTEREVRKIKQDNKYIWQPDFANKGAGTLLGYNVVKFNDMPDIATNALAVAFGDFRRGYQIVDRLGIRVLRDPYTSKPHVKFYTTRRTGGRIKDFDAIKLMKVN